MVTYVYRDGKRLTPRMLYQINRLDTDLRRRFRVGVIVSDGLRTAEEQEVIWYARMTTAAGVRGRTVYETRWWNGQMWYRISPLGTVAPPRTSNHEIQGNTGAADLRDTGADAGITVKNSERGRWIRQHAHEYELVAEGDGFGEGWHFKALNIFAAVPSAGGGKTVTPNNGAPIPAGEEEDEEMAPKFTIRRTKNTASDAEKNTIRYALSEASSGYWEEHVDSHAGNMNKLATAYGTPDAIEQTGSAFATARTAHAAKRAGKA